MAKKRPQNKNKNSKYFQGQNFAETENKINDLDLLKAYNSISNPLDLLNSASTTGIETINKNVEYKNRYEMYSDAFTREMVKVIIGRAIGSTHDNLRPFKIEISEDIEVPEKIAELIKPDFLYLEKLINATLLEVALDSQFYGDGYSRLQVEDKKGVVGIQRNISTAPFNITPIESTQNGTIAYEIPKKSKLFKSGETSINSRFYVAPLFIARMDAPSNGKITLTNEQYTQINDLNVFDKESIYEDGIDGGVMEDCYEDFLGYKWAIRAISNTRIASSVIERFMTLALNTTNDEERKLLKKSLESQIKNSFGKIKKKISDKNPDLLIANHIIPTTTDGTGGVSIQESNPVVQGFQNIDDIMLHIRKFLGAVGFNIEMTSFGGMSVGGTERDGVIQNSIQMDIQGSQLRQAIRGYISQICSTHFLAKYNLDINMNVLSIKFESVVNQTKIEAETQRMETLTNTQQVFGIVEQIKGMQLQDTPLNRDFIKGLLEDIIQTSATKRDEQIEAICNIIFTKQPQDNGE